MPASSVSLSNISVATVSVASTPVATRDSGPVSQGSDTGQSFGHWMQQMRNAGSDHARADGESLPEEGKTLPAERQAAADEEATQEGDSTGSVARGSGSDARSGEDEVEGDVAAQGAVEAEQLSGGSDQVADEAAGEQVVDLEVDLDVEQVGQADMEDSPSTDAAEENVATQSPVVDTESEGESQEAQSGADGVAVKNSVPDLPEQAARSDVREAALQNHGRGRSVEEGEANHGQRVSSIASADKSEQLAGESAKADVSASEGVSPEQGRVAVGERSGEASPTVEPVEAESANAEGVATASVAPAVA
ncbi:MAG: hypothetical protein GYB21_18190, partial [Oceanospirillales bacterium]|nr:hypothetical protein [Oceanospirillales bacterium]